MKRFLFLIMVYSVSLASHAQTCTEGSYQLSDKEWVDVSSKIITAFFTSEQVQLLNTISGNEMIYLYTPLIATPDLISLLKAQNPKLFFINEEHNYDYYWYGTEFQLNTCTTYETCKEARFLTNFITKDKDVSIGASMKIVNGHWNVVGFDVYDIRLKNNGFPQKNKR